MESHEIIQHQLKTLSENIRATILTCEESEWNKVIPHIGQAGHALMMLAAIPLSNLRTKAEYEEDKE